MNCMWIVTLVGLLLLVVVGRQSGLGNCEPDLYGPCWSRVIFGAWESRGADSCNYVSRGADSCDCVSCGAEPSVLNCCTDIEPSVGYCNCVSIEHYWSELCALVNMSTAMRARTAARGWLTRSSKKLNTLCSGSLKDLDKAVLTDCIEEFDKRLNALDEAQCNLELELDEADLENDIEESANYRDQARGPRIKAAKLLAALLADDKDSHSSGTRSTAKADVKLPKLELPDFSGEPLEWQSFWDQFRAVIDESDLPDVNKFTYLRSLLTGEAKAAIKGLSLTSAHYKHACELLEQRFGRKERLIFAHIQDLLNISVPKSSKVSVLWKLQDELQSHVRSLEALEVTGSQFGVILTPLILSRLPLDVRMEWARDGEGHEGDLPFLLDFLAGEIKRRERSQSYKDCGTESRVISESRQQKSPASASALPVSSSDNDNNHNSVSCNLCSKKHSTDKCWNITRIPVSERAAKIRKAGLCYKCFSKSHLSPKCSAKCPWCAGTHHKLLCMGDKNKMSGASGLSDQTDLKSVNMGIQTSHTGVTNTSHLSTSTPVLLQTARVTVKGRSGLVQATVLFDTGSDRSYISRSLVDKLGPQWVGNQHVAYAAFGSKKPSKSEFRNVFNVYLKGNNGDFHSLLVTEVPVICAPVYSPEIPRSVMDSFGNLPWADSGQVGQAVSVDILIGLDAYWRFINGGKVVSIPDQRLCAQESVFGWIVSGALVESGLAHSAVSHQLFCVSDVPESQLRTLWDLESIGITKDEPSDALDQVLNDFHENLSFSEGRYEVALPWKSTIAAQKLKDNENQARARLASLDRKLARNPELLCKYDKVLEDMETSGIVEEVPAGEKNSVFPIFYMPHRPVVRESSETTKVRPVFDASAKGSNGLSLNDCVETGPNLIANLTEVLMRFRRWKVALTSDITKAFLQIAVRRQDQDAHRFLWNHQGRFKVMRFLRVPFGNRSSPFLLCATLQHHLSSFPRSRVVEELQDNLYVDDWLSGADSDEEACDMIVEATEVMDQASMGLAKWSSNSVAVGELLQREFQDKMTEGEVIRVLGIKWLAASDCFTFDGIEIPSGLCVTKRVVLSFIARLFDPLGFAAPFVMMAKCIFQDLWKLGLQWDDPVPIEYQSRFLQWVGGLECLRQWQIPRNYTGGAWSHIRHLQLHAFGDASEKGYGACVYLRAELSDGTVTSSLVVAKAKVAPLKRVTLPRLELLASLLCARLLVFVRQALKLPADTGYMCWSDSMVALSWIQSDPTRWKTFVANRVTEIQELTSPDHWSHCPGSQNPSDLLTRGVWAEELVTSDLWLRGPSFLVEEDSYVKGSQCQDVCLMVSELREQVESSQISTVVGGDPVFEICRWGTLSKALRVVGWLLRFSHNVRSPSPLRKSGDLTLDELNSARSVLIRCTQQQEYGSELESLHKGHLVAKSSSIAKLSPFIGEDGLLRVKGRLEFAELSYDERHPIILPKSHLSLLLVRFQHKLLKHAGVPSMIVSLRNHYWIVGVRRLAKRVKKECVSCQRQDAPSANQPWAPLPALRVKQAPPFVVTGLDHGGPLYCTDSGGKKFYILLFTCGVVRAVHLELVNSLTMEDTLMALRRFIARRGLPSTLYSDNAKNFVATESQLWKHFGPLRPEWKFIAPRGPWWGGFYERLVKSVKTALKKSLGSRSLTRTELETTLHECEACINSRPLTFVGDDLDSGQPLTPAHFLVGRGALYQPAGSQEYQVSTAQELVSRLEVRDLMLNRFWSVWNSEYVRNLPTCTGSKARGELLEGSIVLVQGEGSTRMHWPLGIIEKVFPGIDGIVRTVQVRTAKGLLIRPIQRIHDLEITRGRCEGLELIEKLSECHTDHENMNMDIMNVDGINKPEHDSMDAVNVGSAITPPDCDSSVDTVNGSATALDETRQKSQDVCVPPPTRTRVGRIVKGVQKLNL